MRSRGGCATVEYLRALALVRQNGLSHSSESRAAGLSCSNESCATDPPRSSRPHLVLGGRAPPSEDAFHPPRSRPALRIGFSLSGFTFRPPSPNRVFRARIALLGFGFRSPGSRSVPPVRVPLPGLESHSLGLLSLSGFKSRLPACIPPFEPEFRSSSSHSALRAGMPLLRLTLALQVGMSHLWFALALRTRISPNPSGRLKPHHRISPCLHHRRSPYLHRMFHVKHSFAHRKPCLAPPPRPLCSCDPAALRFAR